MTKILLFDVNETLLDLNPMKPHFERVFGAADVSKQWFATLLHSSLTVTLADDYHDFSALAGSALDALAEQQQVSLAAADRDAILDTMKNLPPHAEVPASLERLRSKGFRLFTLTNSPTQTLAAQMKNSGLREFFEDFFSVESVRKFKPAIEPYQFAAEKLSVKTAETTMIAAHDWDIAGALNAGCQTAYIARKGKTYNSLYRKPHISGDDLSAIADQLIGE